MIEILHRSTAKLSITLMLIVSLVSVAAPSAAAFDGLENEGKDGARDAQISRPAQTTPVVTVGSQQTAASEAKPFTIAYALFSGAAIPRPEIILSGDQPQLDGILNRTNNVSSHVNTNVSANVSFNIKSVAGKRLSTIPLPPGAPAASTAPLTAGEKFNSWAKRFISPGSYGAAAASGLWNEFLDNDEGKDDTIGNYFADAATRAARSYAFGTTAGFFEKFAFASLFRQDPRYHRSDKRGAGAKVSYAVSRVFITQGDRCGCDQFNASFLIGGLTAAGISNVWEREERQTVGKTFQRWGTHIAIRALSNILREFIGGQ
jgi:hypothetical protein